MPGRNLQHMKHIPSRLPSHHRAAGTRHHGTEYDVLLSEGESYAARLQTAGVPTTIRRYDGMTHGFVHLSGVFDVGKQAVSDVAEHLRQVFNE